MDAIRPVNDRSQPTRLMHAPPKKRKSRHRNDKRLHGKQVSNLVHGEPDRRQRDQPENKKRYKVPRIRMGALGERVWDVLKRRPDSRDHEVHACPADPGLHAIPHACHACAVENGPERSPNPE